MDPNRQIIKISEFRGWKNGIPPAGLRVEKVSRLSTEYKMPDYLNDLNAIHEVISNLPLNLINAFEKNLCEIFIAAKPKQTNHFWWETLLATAPQLCEALLKTIGEWETNEKNIPSKAQMFGEIAKMVQCGTTKCYDHNGKQYDTN